MSNSHAYAAETQDCWNYRVRGETPHQRLDRNYAELLQEVRVAQTGTQLLLAFLLTLAFTPRFTDINDFQRVVYVISLVLGSGSTGLLIAPAAFHRVVVHQRLKHKLVAVSSRFACCGLLLLMLALSSALLLILDFVLGSPLSVWITGAVTVWYSLWWYALPLYNRTVHRQAQPATLTVVPPTTREEPRLEH